MDDPLSRRAALQLGAYITGALKEGGSNPAPSGDQPNLPQGDLGNPDGRGSLLIMHKRAGSGPTFARTLRQWDVVGGMEESVHNWINPDLDAAILGQTNGLDLSTYLQAAP